jgi:hypothetical protein
MNGPNEPITDRDLLFVALSGGLWWIKLTFQLWRRTRYLEEALLREQLKRFELERTHTAQWNEKQRRLLEAFLRGPKSTLRELVSDTETEYETKP